MKRIVNSIKLCRKVIILGCNDIASRNTVAENLSGQETSQRVVFGAGLRHSIGDELDRLGCSRALILSTPEQSNAALDIAGMLGKKAAGVFSGAAMHTPVQVTEDALVHANAVAADCYVAVGGGSTTGLGKALALRTDLPQLVVPTTYAGSEATPILGQTEGGKKTTLKDPKVLPEVIIYDPELVVTLPKAMSATSGLNAIAHAAEALYAKDRTAQSTQLAIDGINALVAALPLVLANPFDVAAREQSLRGAWACGAVLGQVGMALHHKLCHTLGGSFDLPHAPTHAAVLPHAVAYNAVAVPELLAPITAAMGGGKPGLALWSFAGKIGTQISLRELGLKESDLARAAEIAISNPYWNPRPLTTEGIRGLLSDAWSGTAPAN